MTQPPALYGCVVVPQMSIQAALRLRPRLVAHAVVMMEGSRPHELVFGMNHNARELGLREGMTRIEVETFNVGTILPRSTSEEQAARNVLLEAMSAHTPRLEPRGAAADWECILDLAGSERLMGDAQQLGARIVGQLLRLGFQAWIVFSQNADAGLSFARHLAWNSTKTTHELTQAAKMLAPLRLDVLRMEQDACDRFRTWGIETLGELAALPEAALIARLGQFGKQLRLRACGELPHLLKPAGDEFVLEEAMELEESLDSLEPLLFVLNPMLEQLLLRAQGRAYALAAITIAVLIELPADRELGEGRSARQEEQWFTRTIRPAVPTLNRSLFLKMLQLDLEAHPPPGAIRQVKLSAETGESSRIQLGLFAPQMPEPTRFEDVHIRLVSLVGETNVGRIRLLDTHAPESFVLERFKLPGTGYREASTKSVVARPATAMRRLRPPVTVQVKLRGQEITAFWFESRRFEVLRCFGPWRSSGGWWHDQRWSTDTWDLAAQSEFTEELLVCLIGHDLVRHQWWLEGVYD